MTGVVWATAAVAVAGALVLLVRRARREPVLELAGSGSFARARTRTRLMWCSLVVALVALLSVFAFEAGAESSPPILRPGTNAVIVVDLSGSALPASKGIARVLLGLARDPHRRLGLVVFSDSAYEALPPSTPVDGIKGWLELFQRGQPWNYPWASSFASGTTISSGLVLARKLLRRDRVVHPHVVLVSDLADSESDLQRLETVMAQYRREGIDLTVIKVQPGVKPAPGTRLGLPNADFVAQAADRTVDPTPSGSTDLTPIVLAVLVGVLAVLAAAGELALHPLTWGVRS